MRRRRAASAHAAAALAGLAALSLLLASCSSRPSVGAAGSAGAWDWPTYGHDAQHTFHGRTTLTPAQVKTLKPAWIFNTGDAVTADPTVVNGVVYAGSWDGHFYAVNFYTGKLLWKFTPSLQDAVHPYPGEKPRDISSDGGLITDSAWYQPGAGSRPDLVIFGGGYTLYALDAHTGHLYWRHDYTGRPWEAPDPDQDGTRLFSSPVVVGNKVLFGVDVDGQRDSTGYVVAASLSTGKPEWEFQTDVNTKGQVLRDGCGSVWASGTVLPAQGLVVFDGSDCDFSNDLTYSEAVFALHISNGTLAWRWRPARVDVRCDYDFGATPNAGLNSRGRATFLGVGGKDGTYYSLNPTTGKERWRDNVVFGGFSGGFIATLAYDGHTVYGSTAIGDFGRFEKSGQVLCDPSDPRDKSMQEPSVHAFNAATGKIRWQASKAASFAPTTVAGGMTFNGLALNGTVIQVRDATTGSLIKSIEIPDSNWSGISTVGDALVFGTGSTYRGNPAGIEVLTPGGAPPQVPS